MRLSRHLFDVLALLSLLACLAVLASRGRAQFGDRVWLRFAGHALIVYGASGEAVRWSTLKNESGHHERYETREQAWGGRFDKPRGLFGGHLKLSSTAAVYGGN